MLLEVEDNEKERCREDKFPKVKNRNEMQKEGLEARRRISWQFVKNIFNKNSLYLHNAVSFSRAPSHCMLMNLGKLLIHPPSLKRCKKEESKKVLGPPEPTGFLGWCS